MYTAWQTWLQKKFPLNTTGLLLYFSSENKWKCLGFLPHGCYMLWNVMELLSDVDVSVSCPYCVFTPFLGLPQMFAPSSVEISTSIGFGDRIFQGQSLFWSPSGFYMALPVSVSLSSCAGTVGLSLLWAPISQMDSSEEMLWEDMGGQKGRDPWWRSYCK